MAGVPALPAGLLDRVTALAETLAPLAADVDAGAGDGTASLKLLKDAGLLRSLVPRDAGGDGLSFAQYTRVLEVIGARDVATALALNMHNVSIGALREAAAGRLGATGRAFADWVFREITEHDRMFASATSEAGTGAKLRGVRTTYRRSEGTYVLGGRKSFVSLAGVADYYVVAARDAAEDAENEVSHFVVSATDEGVTFGTPWTGQALAGTHTADMTLDGVRLGRERLFLGVEGMSLFKLVREPHWMVSGYTGAYLGLAVALVRELTACVRDSPARAASPVTVRELGRLSARLAAARALTYTACAEVDAARGTPRANTAVHAAKYAVAELLTELVASAPRLAGTTALDRRRALHRYLREAPFCSVMPAKPDECLDYVGKSALGVDLADARAFDW
ncbi:acyl-CoA dehydrogenase family protein [Streptomyces sp.]|uniref:acyl-CoA dehydrogenase family protein n=1 Tax=Streptomyces sp. TaxID=1931 RepID=UPI002D46DF77|nr:acyl-CoA dehydrogenase family protein [Streptomyces sp.]HZF89584.1 acyl-CoA dehydrogenase family protein [Streptomyces sp.]